MIEGRYSLEEQIGIGGMATVWRATDTLLGRQLAIKRLSPHLKADRAASERFRREGQAAAQLNHPGILTVFDAGEDDDGPWIAMELIEGETLAHRLAANGPMDPATVAGFIEQAAAAVDYAHENGIVHRDIKPANLMIEPDGRIRLADFGIAKPLGDSATITSPGEMVGTISYVAPEIINGDQASAASDIYSLGAVAYEMLTGEKPFTADTTAGLLDAIRRADGPLLSGKVPEDAAPAIARAMSRDPSLRPESARAFAAELAQNGTLVMPLDGTRSGDPPASPMPTVGSPDEPTIQMIPVPGTPVPFGNPDPSPMAVPELASPPDPEARSGMRGRTMAATGVLALLVLVAAMALSGEDPAGPDTSGASTSTTTTTVITTTTIVTTAIVTTAPPTTAAQSAPALLAGQISDLLGGLQPPDYKPKDVKEVEDRVYRAIDQWENDDSEAALETLNDALARVGEFPESETRDELVALLAELAEAMGLDKDD